MAKEYNQRQKNERRMLENHHYEWDDIVIGGTLNAVKYAHLKGYHIVFNTLDKPFAFDPRSDNLDLGSLELAEDSYDLDVWHSLSYRLFERGLHPFVDKVQSVSIDSDNNTIEVVVDPVTAIKIKYKRLYVMDDENVHGIPDNFETKGYRVFDWFKVRSGTKHAQNFLRDKNSDFVKCIYFYLSDRIDGNKIYKDLVAESYLDKNKITDPEYSDSISRLKTMNMMKDAGIKGAKNGSGTFLPIRIELEKREILKIKKTNYLRYNNIIVSNDIKNILEDDKNENFQKQARRDY